jgi:competence protein ComEC
MTKTLFQAPFLRLTLFFISGIIVQTQWNLYPYWICSGLIALPILFISFLPKMKRKYNLRWLFGFGLFILCFSSAGILSRYHWEKSEWQGDGKEHLYKIQILDDPVQKPKTLMFRIKIEEQEALIYIPTDTASSALRPSNSLLISAKFEKVNQMYLRKQGIAARAFVGRWEKLEITGKQTFNLRFLSLKCRRNLLNYLWKIIPDEKSFSVAAALMFGYVNEMDKDLRQTFSATGSAHILSVSGLHFSIIYGMLYFLFSFLGNDRKGKMLRQAIILPILWFFVFLTGMGPSVIRAASMLTLWGFGNVFLFRAFTINTVGVAAFFMLLYNPFNLFDVGFQLSFSAVLAILFIHTNLVKLYEPRNPLIQYVWELSSVSTSAQLGTAPLCIYYFRQFPLLFLITNLFAVPVTGVLLALLPVSLFLHFLFGNISWLMLPVNKMLTVFIFTLEQLEAIPNGLVQTEQISVTDIFCLFLAIILGTLLFLRKRIVYLYLLAIVSVSRIIYYLCI